MSERCEPPPEWRGKDGWHWLYHPRWEEWPARYSAPCHVGIWPIWQCPDSNWTTPAAHREGYRYLAPVTPPATVAALVEALEWYALDYDHHKGRSQWDGGTKARQVLALYREAGR